MPDSTSSDNGVDRNNTMNPGWITQISFLPYGGYIIEREPCELVAFSITLPTESSNGTA